ncbi:MAG: YsnF/AvaK domain-containing protein [Janthinobacterium lividum]
MNPISEGVPTGDASRADPGVEVVLHAEQLRVARERVGVERVRFAKRIVTTTRTIEVPVRVEQLVVSHEALTDGTVSGSPAHLANDVVIVLHEEIPEVTLRVVPVERVLVQVRSVVGEQSITADLRSETADLEVDEADRSK